MKKIALVPILLRV